MIDELLHFARMKKVVEAQATFAFVGDVDQEEASVLDELHAATDNGADSTTRSGPTELVAEHGIGERAPASRAF